MKPIYLSGLQMVKTWKDSVPDPMMATLPTNSALTIKDWLEIVQTEHAYPRPVVVQPSSPKKSPIKSHAESDSVSCQVGIDILVTIIHVLIRCPFLNYLSSNKSDIWLPCILAAPYKYINLLNN